MNPNHSVIIAMGSKNAVKKGRDTETAAMEVLLKEGWISDKKPRLNRRRGYNCDLFGVFDIVALKEYRCRWIQVKFNKRDISKARREITKWISENHLISGVRMLFEIWWYTGDGKNHSFGQEII